MTRRPVHPENTLDGPDLDVDVEIVAKKVGGASIDGIMRCRLARCLGRRILFDLIFVSI